MMSMMFKNMLALVMVMPLVVYSQSPSSYLAPRFTDPNRLIKIKPLFPELDKLYQGYAQQNHIPGYVFAIIVDGQTVYIGKGGYADLKQKTAVTAHTRFRIASMTKSFTAMAILKLRDQGQLKLDDPVSRYIPAMKQQRLTSDSAEITLRDLLTHGTGLPEDNPWGDRHLNITHDQLEALMKRGVSFANPTGTAYEYSNLGYAILGLVIEQVSGLSYQDYIAKNIWQPLGMSESAWEYATIPAHDLAQGYQWDGAHWQQEELLHDGSFAAMGGMITSVDSFSRYLALHLSAWPPRDDQDRGPVKRSSIREMHYPWRLYNLNLNAHLDQEKCPTIAAYGYGFRWLRDCQRKVVVGHSGGLPGFGSNWLIAPEYGIGVVLLTNVTYADAEAINLKVVNKLIQDAALQPRTLPSSAILEERKKALLKVLPDWRNAQTQGIFAVNFFLDHPIALLKQQAQELFTAAGTITSVGKVIAKNQLRGYFILYGKKANLKISFSLSPDNPALIQSYVLGTYLGQE